MQFLKNLLALATIGLTLVRATSVLLPLYVYPSDADWAEVYTALGAHPELDFYIVVNPADGPTPTPDAAYTAGITRLKTFDNAIIVGYVATGFGRLSAATIGADIDEWRSWPIGVRPTGIFFDEAERGEVAGSWRILRSVADYAVSTGIGEYTVNNIGSRPVNNTIYDFADETIIYENSWAAYPASSAEIDAITTPPEQLSIIIYSLPQAQLQSQVLKFAERGYGTVYFTDGPGYTDIYPTFAQFVELLDEST